MNILIFTTAFHPSIGGLESQTLTLAYEFLKEGHNVKVVTLQFQASAITSTESKLQNISIHYCPNLLKKLQLLMWCDILYMPNISLNGIWLLFLYPFKKWVVSHNGFYLSNRRSIKTRIKLLMIKFASHNITVSKSVASYINTKSTIIYNCYDNEVFKIYKDEERIYDFVFLGRLVSQKGCDSLIEACTCLKESFTLNIIGDGPERVKLEKMVHDLDLKINIKFLGILEGVYLARMLNRHKIMVIPSKEKEGFGIVALEGLACGCRIIAADAGGLSEAVNGFGKIFKMRDQSKLESLLVSEIMELKQFGDNVNSTDMSDYLAAHTKEAIARKYLCLFKEVSLSV